jgi:predicted transcriptional regulator
MKSKGTRTVKPSDLKTSMFVRKELDQDRVLYLAELIESGVEMKDRIQVTDDLTIVAGRHRREAYEVARKAEIVVELKEFESDSEMIAYAYKENVGGSLPPTRQDTEHTISLLIGQGESPKRIADLLGLPPSMIRTYANEVKAKIARQKMLNAVSAVSDGGLTVTKAAESYGVEIDKLKEAISGRRKKTKEGFEGMQRNITWQSKSSSAKLAASLRSLLEKFDDGDVTERQVREIFSHIEDLQKRSSRAVADWKKRFEAIVKGEKAAKAG